MKRSLFQTNEKKTFFNFSRLNISEKNPLTLITDQPFLTVLELVPTEIRNFELTSVSIADDIDSSQSV